MQRIVVFTTGLVLALAVTLAPALAEKRVALVIGNSAYQHVQHLPNPANDAEDMAAALERLGFAVTRMSDLTYDAMRRSLRDFGNEALGADMALVFFAGHGMEINRQNYLVPVDARLGTDLDVEYEAVPLDMVMSAVERAKGLRLVLLDACRNNPFAASIKMTSPTRAIGRGLSRVEPSTGTLVVFAAKEGTVAADGRGRNSPYTRALLARIEQPGLEVNLLFRQVRDQVVEETGGTQEPFTYGSLPGTQIFLKPPEQLTKPQPMSDDTAVELAFWNSVKATGNPALIEAYRRQYPQGRFVSLAELMIEAIEAERARMEQGAAMKAAQEEAAMKAAQEEAARKKAGEEAAKAAVIASLESTNEEAVKEADKAQDHRALALQVQVELERIGCDPGRPDGAWGKGSERALAGYARHAGVKLAALEPSQELLDELRSRQGRVCPLVCGPRFDARGDRCVLKTCPKGQELAANGACVAVVSKQQSPVKNADKTDSAGEQCGECALARSLSAFQVDRLQRYCGEQYLWRKRAGMCRQ